MKVELSDKEVQRVGYGRYMTTKRTNGMVFIFVGIMLLAVAFMLATEGKMNEIGSQLITCGILIIGVVVFFSMYFKAEKAGKKFLEDMKKQNEGT